jgi:hypothetical protein
MVMLSLFNWWYGAGWAGVIRSTWRRLANLARMFSIPILLRTLFAPWRRIITYPSAGIDAKLRAFGDNLVSRCIGFTVRLFALIAAAVMLVLVSCMGLVELIAWPLIPLAGITLVVKGLL